MSYYQDSMLLSDKQGNNAISFEDRQKLWSDASVRIPSLKVWSLEDLRIAYDTLAYEYIDEDWILVSWSGLEYLLEIPCWTKSVYIIDNHNHAFAMRWRSYLKWDIERWGHLIHIDQHSDLAEPLEYLQVTRWVSQFETNQSHLLLSSWKDDMLKAVDRYTNEILTIADFIKPAKNIGLVSDYTMILTEYALLQDIWSTLNLWSSIIVDIDLDFRAPEMSIAQYDQTISQVRALIDLPQVGCVTIATSPTYIDQALALEILKDLLW